MKIEDIDGKSIEIQHNEKEEVVLKINMGYDVSTLRFTATSATKLVDNLQNGIEISRSKKTKSVLDKYAYSLFTRKVIIVPSHLVGQVIAYAKSIYQIEAEDCGKDESGENSAIMRLTINSKDY